MESDLDIIIVGAGISGINAAQRIQTNFPHLTYTILEARDAIGGTWDLFKYPGIRSDSDLYTFGFPWRLWESTQAIADGPSIKKYLEDSATEFGIDEKIRYHHKLDSADWSSKTQSWSLRVGVDGEIKAMRAKFLIYGAGYYDYETPLHATVPNIGSFKGTTVHPQFWPQDLDYSNKNIVIIGSGATAVTILPVLAKTAKSVTLLQRSPTYILSAPAYSSGSWLRFFFPSSVAHQLIRWKFMWAMYLYFQFCRLFPSLAIFQIKADTKKQLPAHIKQDPHFKPRYNPWEQRLCVCPDGDFYEALRGGNVDVVTDTIQTVTSTGVSTTNGQNIDADIIVTATGLKMRFAGGVQIHVDGTKIHPSEKYMWKGTLLQDIPNAAFLQGYTNASWTLGAEASMQLVCRLLAHMQKKRLVVVVPRVTDESKIRATNMMNLKSTYILAAKGVLPKGGDVGPWKARVNYFKDFWNAKWGGLDELEFLPATEGMF